MGTKGSKVKGIDVPDEGVMYQRVSRFFQPSIRSIIESTPITEYNNEFKLVLLDCFGVKNSTIEETFLNNLTPKFISKYYSNDDGEKEFSLDSILEDFHLEGLYVEKVEEDLLSIFLQAIHFNVFVKKRPKFDLGYLVLVTKFQFVLQQVLKIKEEKYRHLVRTGVVVDERCIEEFCRLKVKREDLISNNGEFIPISYIVTSSRNESNYQKLQKSLVVNMNLLPLYDFFSGGNKSFLYGVFHPSVKIGSVLLEWDSFSLVGAQTFENSWSTLNSHAAFSVCDVPMDSSDRKSIEVLDNLVQGLNEIMFKWNRSMIYSKTHHKELRGNCHHFFQEVCDCLKRTLPDFKEKENVTKMMECLNRVTSLDMGIVCKHGISKELLALKNPNVSKLKSAKNHEEFDNFFKEIQKDINFDEFQDDFEMFKAIDSGFWFVFISNITIYKDEENTS